MARVYDGFFDWALGPGRRHSVARLPVEDGDRVLEVGVGTGLSLPLYPDHARITGIDISDPMLEKARDRARGLPQGPERVQLLQMDARRLDFPDDSFDHVLAPYVLSVVPDPEVVMSEMVRVCRPGGTVMVTNHFLSRSPLLGFVEKRFTPLSQWIGFRLDLPIERVTETSGLQVEQVDRVNMFGLWRMVLARKTGS
ncbi:hypothetical protein ABI59_02785 [Acidobacteria bacterium Mor1]|nr:hypothetical protein ABI59_02785 [Acidobacteria bacterium Mor1]